MSTEEKNELKRKEAIRKELKKKYKLPSLIHVRFGADKFTLKSAKA